MAVFRMRAVSVISTMKVLWAAAEFVAGADAGENAIGQTERGLASRHETADLGHQLDEGHLADVGAFTGHVGAGDEQDEALVGRGEGIVGDERAVGQKAIEHRMPAIADGKGWFVDKIGAAIITRPG